MLPGPRIVELNVGDDAKLRSPTFTPVLFHVSQETRRQMQKDASGYEMLLKTTKAASKASLRPGSISRIWINPSIDTLHIEKGVLLKTLATDVNKIVLSRLEHLSVEYRVLYMFCHKGNNDWLQPFTKFTNLKTLSASIAVTQDRKQLFPPWGAPTRVVRNSSIYGVYRTWELSLPSDVQLQDRELDAATSLQDKMVDDYFKLPGISPYMVMNRDQMQSWLNDILSVSLNSCRRRWEKLVAKNLSWKEPEIEIMAI